MSIVCSSVGSSTMTGWKRRSRAASRSMYLRYSSSVVAPMHWSSPRASGGLRMLAASIAPSAAPAPTSVCSSSMNRTASFVLRSSSMIFLSRSSNSPRYLVPATSDPMSRVRTRLLMQRLGDVAGDDPMGEALGDRGLADARLADQGRVVLRPSRQDLDDPLDLLVAADDRVELACSRGVGQVDAELVDGRGLAGALRLRRRAGGRALRQDPDDLVADLVEVDAERLEDTGGDPLALADEAEEQVLRADVVVAEAAGLVDGQLDDALGPWRQPDLADDRAVAATDDELDRRPHLRQLDVHVLEDARGDTLALADEAEEQMLRADVVVVEPLRLVLSQRQDLARAIRELVEAIHRVERLFPSRAPRTCRSGHASTTTLAASLHLGAGSSTHTNVRVAAFGCRPTAAKKSKRPAGVRRVVVVRTGAVSLRCWLPSSSRRSPRSPRPRAASSVASSATTVSTIVSMASLAAASSAASSAATASSIVATSSDVASASVASSSATASRIASAVSSAASSSMASWVATASTTSTASSVAAGSLASFAAAASTSCSISAAADASSAASSAATVAFRSAIAAAAPASSTASSSSAVASTAATTSAATASSAASSAATVSTICSIASVAAASSAASSSATVSTTSSTSAAASCWRTWAKADARVLSIPPSGSWTASDIE